MKRLANIGQVMPLGGAMECSVAGDDKARPELTPGKAARTIEALSTALVAADANSWNLDRANKHLYERAASAEKCNAHYRDAFDLIYDTVGGVPDKTPLTLEATLDVVVKKVAALASKRRGRS